MTLLEWYFDNAISGLAQTTILPVIQWKYKFVSSYVLATGSSTVTTTSKLRFVNPLDTSPRADITATTTSTNTAVSSQQYPAGTYNTYFNPLVGNTLEEIQAYIQNAASISGNLVMFCIEVDLDGDFDE